MLRLQTAIIHRRGHSTVTSIAQNKNWRQALFAIRRVDSGKGFTVTSVKTNSAAKYIGQVLSRNVAFLAKSSWLKPLSRYSL